MKKLLTLTTLVIAGIASGASIDWTMKTGAMSMKAADGTTSTLSGTAYLILTGDLSNLEKDIAKDGLTAVIDDYKLGEASLSGGKNSTKQTATSTKLKNDGTEYTFQVVIYDSTNNKYYVSQPSASEVAYAGTDDPTGVSFTAAQLYATNASTPSSATWSSSQASGGGGAIPEPATGALALAGVALLFKRRRA